MDFESEASTARSKIEEYFSHLIETLKKRQTKLVSELDEILSNYRQQRAKIKELEKLNEQLKQNSSSSTVKEILNGFIDKTKTELFSLEEKTSITVRFEWNQKYAREASELGTLETDNLDGILDPDTSFTTTEPNTRFTTIGPNTSFTKIGPNTSFTKIGPNTSFTKIGPNTSLTTIGPNTSFTKIGPNTSLTKIGPNTSFTKIGPNTSLTKIGPNTSFTKIGPNTSLTTIGPNTSLTKIGPNTSLTKIGPNTSLTTITPSHYEDDLVDELENDLNELDDDYPYTSPHTFYQDNTVTKPIARSKYNFGGYTPQAKRIKTRFQY